jgi:hypothetical protein
VDGFSREGYRCRCWAHEMDCARMRGCDPVLGRGGGHIGQWGAPSNNQPKPIAGQLLADDRTWCRRSRNPQGPSALQLGNRPKPAAGRLPTECRRCCRRILRAPTRSSPAVNRPGPAAGRRPADCRRWYRSQRASPRAAALQPAGAGCRTAPSRVQEIVSSEPASLPARRSPATGRSR